MRSIAMAAVIACCCAGVAVALDVRTPGGDVRIYDVTEPLPTVATVSNPGGEDDGREVVLPTVVQHTFYDLTIGIFEFKGYEYFPRLSSLFSGGRVTRVSIPGREDIDLYVYSLGPYNPPFEFLLLHEPKTDRVTSQPPRFYGNLPEYSPQFIRFQDIYGDDRNEIVIMTGHHLGTEVNLIELEGLSIEEDLSLARRLELETGQMLRGTGKMFDQEYGYVVRTIEKLGPEQILVTTSLSKTRLEPGTYIKSVEMYEIGRKGLYKPSEVYELGENGRYESSKLLSVVSSDDGNRSARGTSASTSGVAWAEQGPPPGMVLIPGGSNSGTNPLGGEESYGPREVPATYALTVSSFYMDRCPVTKAQWDEVYAWAFDHGYRFEHAGLGKAANHPVHTVNWYDCVKWCNARSEMEGRPVCYRVSGNVYRTMRSDSVTCDWTAGGYRLPTDEEWEYAARGGVSSKRFPWGEDTISHSRANYRAGRDSDYDESYPPAGCHPAYNDDVEPYTSPVGSFEGNGYGLHDMAGNVLVWCFDLKPGYAKQRVIRGGSWISSAVTLRTGARAWSRPVSDRDQLGFRAVVSVADGQNRRTRQGHSRSRAFE